MRISLPDGLIAWSALGGALLVFSSMLILNLPGHVERAFSVILVVFAIWAAAGAEGLVRLASGWRKPWNRVSLIAATGLPLIVILAAFSQCLMLSGRDQPRPLPEARSELSLLTRR